MLDRWATPNGLHLKCVNSRYDEHRNQENNQICNFCHHPVHWDTDITMNASFVWTLSRFHLGRLNLCAKHAFQPEMEIGNCWWRWKIKKIKRKSVSQRQQQSPPASVSVSKRKKTCVAWRQSDQSEFYVLLTRLTEQEQSLGDSGLQRGNVAYGVVDLGVSLQVACHSKKNKFVLCTNLIKKLNWKRSTTPR